MNPQDTFQIIAFSNTVRKLADQPLPVSYLMKLKAHAFISGLEADGGTVMMPAIEAACNMPADKNRLRIVTLMTDGFIDKNDSIAQIWARARIDELMSQDWEAMQFNIRPVKPEVVGEIIQTSLDYHVMSQFTSFVAVDSAIAELNDDDDKSAADDPDKATDCQKTDDSKCSDAATKTDASAKPEQPKLSQLALPPLNPVYEMLSPKNVVCALGAATIIGAARGGMRTPTFAGVLIATGVGVATVFGFARGALQSTMSQSFSTVVSQLNCLNCYAAASGGSGCGYASYPSYGSYASYGSYTSSPVVAPLSQAYSHASHHRLLTLKHASAAHHKQKSTPAAAAAQQSAPAPAPQIQAAPLAPYDPYNLQIPNPSGGMITLDLQAGALMLQWILFLLALCLLPLTAKARANPKVRSRLLYACAFIFVSLNVQSTFMANLSMTLSPLT